jgi:hypothetical protein
MEHHLGVLQSGLYLARFQSKKKGRQWRPLHRPFSQLPGQSP